MLGEMASLDGGATQDRGSLPVFLEFASVGGEIGLDFPLRFFNLLTEQIDPLLTRNDRLFLGVHRGNDLGFLEQNGILRSLLLSLHGVDFDNVSLFLELLQLLALLFNHFVESLFFRFNTFYDHGLIQVVGLLVIEGGHWFLRVEAPLVVTFEPLIGSLADQKGFVIFAEAETFSARMNFFRW